MIGCWGRLGDDVGGPDRCYGRQCLYTSLLPATLSNPTSSFSQQQNYSRLQATREVTFQATHTLIRNRRHLTILRRRTHSGRLARATHQASCISTTGLDQVHRSLHLSIFIQERHQHAAVRVHSAALLTRPIGGAGVYTSPHEASEGETHTQWRIYGSRLACNVSATLPHGQEWMLTIIRVNTVSWLPPCAHDTHCCRNHPTL